MTPNKERTGSIEDYRSFAQIGIALSAEKNITRLLEMIMNEAKAFSNADAGTLYIMDEDKKHLCFNIMYNDTMNIQMGGTSGLTINLPHVPLYVNGNPNHANVSSYAALTGKIVKIKDVYKTKGFDFSGAKAYDQKTGYRSKSMLVIPMKNHEMEIIGVLQLLNAKDPDLGITTEFSRSCVELIAALASQAAVALTNTQLTKDLKDLFDGFIQTIADAIDEKSHYTFGHINRVVTITMMIAKEINKREEGTFKNIKFTKDELEELSLAAWLHDIGKITTPEYVVDKATKLETIFDRIHMIEARFNYIAKCIENRYLKTKIGFFASGSVSDNEIKFLDDTMKTELTTLKNDFEFVKTCNKSGEFMPDDKIERIKSIAENTYFDINGEIRPYLTDDEVKNLTIRKGTLLDEERKIIENHATVTYNFLSKLPFPRKLARVPEFASSHHEKMDGSGYPKGLTKEELPIQSRIMAIADIFEALTAKDRPYRSAMKLSQAVKILGFMKKDGHIDEDVLELFLDSGIYKEYALKELDPEQIDEIERK